MAKSKHTFAKRQREMEKKQKAEEKRARRQKKRDESIAAADAPLEDEHTAEAGEGVENKQVLPLAGQNQD